MTTPRQRKALDNLVENGGNKYQAAVDAGYSPNTAITPSKVFESKGIQELVAKGDVAGLTDEYALGRLKAAMDSRQFQSVIQAVKLWWSIRYPESKDSTNVNIQNNIINTSDTDVKSGIVDWVKNHPEVHEELKAIIH